MPISKRDKAGRATTDNPKTEWMRLTKEEKQLIEDRRKNQL